MERLRVEGWLGVESSEGMYRCAAIIAPAPSSINVWNGASSMESSRLRSCRMMGKA